MNVLLWKPPSEGEGQIYVTVRRDGTMVRCDGSKWWYNVTLGWYDSTTVRRYNGTTVQQYDGTTVRRYNGIMVQRYNVTTVRRYNGTTVQRYDGTTVQWYNSTTVRRYNGTTVQRYDGTTVQRCDVTVWLFWTLGSSSFDFTQNYDKKKFRLHFRNSKHFCSSKNLFIKRNHNWRH